MTEICAMIIDYLDYLPVFMAKKKIKELEFITFFILCILFKLSDELKV